MTTRIVPSQFLRNLVELVCDEEQLRPASVLRDTGVSWQSLQRDQWLGTFDEQMRVYERVAAISTVPGIGFRSPSASSFADQGLLGVLLITAPNVGEALTALNSYIDVIGGLVGYELKRTRSNVLLSTQPKYSTDAITHRLICEENLAVWKLSSLPIPDLGHYLRRIDVDYAKPKHWPMYEDLFAPAEVAFGRPCNQAVLAKEVLELDIPTSNPAAFAQLQKDCQAIVDRLTPDFIQLIMRYFKNTTPSQWSSDDAAAWMGTSQRTLRRRLRDSDLSYQRALDRYRYQMSQRLIAQGVDRADIAVQLGYKDAYGFERAYARWAGRS